MFMSPAFTSTLWSEFITTLLSPDTLKTIPPGSPVAPFNPAWRNKLPPSPLPLPAPALTIRFPPETFVPTESCA